MGRSFDFWRKNVRPGTSIGPFSRAWPSWCCQTSVKRAAIAASQQPQDEREAFEAWCRSVGRDDRDLQRCADYATTITGSDYSWGDTERAWKAWQARAALSSAPKEE